MIVGVRARIEISDTEWGKYETSPERNWNMRSEEYWNRVKKNIGDETIGVNGTSLITSP